jgi:Fis family transcriptional regulator
MSSDDYRPEESINEEVSIPVPSLSEAVDRAVQNYLSAMDGQEVTELYELVISEIEAPLLAAVLKRTGHNQSRSSAMLGLNSGTLRKKLKKYGLA